MDPTVLEKRLARERRAREEAERILEEKSRELYRSNEDLKAAGAELERQSGQLTAILEKSGQPRLIRAPEVAEAILGFCGEDGHRRNGEIMVIDGTDSA